MVKKKSQWQKLALFQVFRIFEYSRLIFFLAFFCIRPSSANKTRPTDYLKISFFSLNLFGGEEQPPTCSRNQSQSTEEKGIILLSDPGLIDIRIKCYCYWLPKNLSSLINWEKNNSYSTLTLIFSNCSQK